MESLSQQQFKYDEILKILNGFYDGDGRTPFVLSLDGGGIYGLTEAIWLRQLCEAVPGFLVPGQVRVLAGCSAGAANALLLALFESPREAVLAGVLERFWTRTGILSNEGPVTRWTKGWTAMFGAEDEYAGLYDVFGDMTLGDLPNRVLISTFNYTGATAEEHTAPGAFGTVFDRATPDWAALRPDHVFRMGKPPQAKDPKAGQTQRHWRPKFFDNQALNEDDRDLKVVDIAMAAMCVPGIRPFRGGLGDGGLMSADPSMGAVAHLLRQWEVCVDDGLEMTEPPERKKTKEVKDDPQSNPREQIRRILAAGQKYASPKAIREDFWTREKKHGKEGLLAEAKELIGDDKLADKEWVRSRGKGILLSWFKCLSVGPGQALPAYGYRNFDIGLLPAQLLPFNPFDRNFWPQSAYSLDQPSSSSQYTCSRLLSEDRYLRLDPDVMTLPTMVASMMSVSPTLRARIIREIYRQTESSKSKRAVRVATDFLIDNPDDPDNLGQLWGTKWYYTNETPDGVLPCHLFPERVREWEAQRAARETERLKQRPRTPWDAWREAVRKGPWGAYMESLQKGLWGAGMPSTPKTEK
jgi:hypothetical protein